MAAMVRPIAAHSTYSAGRLLTRDHAALFPALPERTLEGVGAAAQGSARRQGVHRLRAQLAGQRRAAHAATHRLGRVPVHGEGTCADDDRPSAGAN